MELEMNKNLGSNIDQFEADELRDDQLEAVTGGNVADAIVDIGKGAVGAVKVASLAIQSLAIQIKQAGG
jgi:hypothetical protein